MTEPGAMRLVPCSPLAHTSVMGWCVCVRMGGWVGAGCRGARGTGDSRPQAAVRQEPGAVRSAGMPERAEPPPPPLNPQAKSRIPLEQEARRQKVVRKLAADRPLPRVLNVLRGTTAPMRSICSPSHPTAANLQATQRRALRFGGRSPLLMTWVVEDKARALRISMRLLLCFCLSLFGNTFWKHRSLPSGPQVRRRWTGDESGGRMHLASSGRPLVPPPIKHSSQPPIPLAVHPQSTCSPPPPHPDHHSQVVCGRRQIPLPALPRQLHPVLGQPQHPGLFAFRAPTVAGWATGPGVATTAHRRRPPAGHDLTVLRHFFGARYDWLCIASGLSAQSCRRVTGSEVDCLGRIQGSRGRVLEKAGVGYTRKHQAQGTIGWQCTATMWGSERVPDTGRGQAVKWWKLSLCCCYSASAPVYGLRLSAPLTGVRVLQPGSLFALHKSYPSQQTPALLHALTRRITSAGNLPSPASSATSAIPEAAAQAQQRKPSHEATQSPGAVAGGRRRSSTASKASRYRCLPHGDH